MYRRYTLEYYTTSIKHSSQLNGWEVTVFSETGVPIWNRFLSDANFARVSSNIRASMDTARKNMWEIRIVKDTLNEICKETRTYRISTVAECRGYLIKIYEGDERIWMQQFDNDMFKKIWSRIKEITKQAGDENWDSMVLANTLTDTHMDYIRTYRPWETNTV